MKITRPMLVGAAVALAGHGVAVGVTMAVVIASGGGPNPDADLDAGGRFAIFFVAAVTYGIAQLALLGGCAALYRRLGHRSLSGLAAGWVLGLAASVYYLCGG